MEKAIWATALTSLTNGSGAKELEARSRTAQTEDETLWRDGSARLTPSTMKDLRSTATYMKFGARTTSLTATTTLGSEEEPNRIIQTISKTTDCLVAYKKLKKFMGIAVDKPNLNATQQLMLLITKEMGIEKAAMKILKENL